mmetsp:Transcript_107035/g.230498  ORF Transcript_107035/g.230498 Transcript_107035/m.230498 type:complete len:201 (+) Transcript_107035:178-780(+)
MADASQFRWRLAKWLHLFEVGVFTTLSSVYINRILRKFPRLASLIYLVDVWSPAQVASFVPQGGRFERMEEVDSFGVALWISLKSFALLSIWACSCLYISVSICIAVLRMDFLFVFSEILFSFDLHEMSEATRVDDNVFVVNEVAVGDTVIGDAGAIVDIFVLVPVADVFFGEAQCHKPQVHADFSLLISGTRCLDTRNS